jgi:hypothetical protein
LLSHGLSFVHCSTPTSEALGWAPGAPWFQSKPLTGHMVPLERNFFTALALARYRLVRRVGRTTPIGHQRCD